MSEFERLRAALHRIAYAPKGRCGPDITECITIAREALAALAPAEGMGDYVLVPREPTEAMLAVCNYEATHINLIREGDRMVEAGAADLYRAMLAAAPTTTRED